MSERPSPLPWHQKYVELRTPTGMVMCLPLATGSAVHETLETVAKNRELHKNTMWSQLPKFDAQGRPFDPRLDTVETVTKRANDIVDARCNALTATLAANTAESVLDDSRLVHLRDGMQSDS